MPHASLIAALLAARATAVDCYTRALNSDPSPVATRVREHAALVLREIDRALDGVAADVAQLPLRGASHAL